MEGKNLDLKTLIILLFLVSVGVLIILKGVGEENFFSKGFAFLLGAGAISTGGVLVYLLRKSDEKIKKEEGGD